MAPCTLNKTLIAGGFFAPPYNVFYEEDGRLEQTGIAGEFQSIVLRSMNATYRIILGNAHGFKFPNGTYDGLFGMLQRKEVDTLFFPYPLNELILADFHAVPVFRFDPVCILSGVQRLHVDDDFAIATTFDPPVWIAILVSWLVVTTVTTVLYRCETRISGRGSQETFTSQLFSYLQVLLMEGTSMDLRRSSVRLAFIGWSLGSVLLGILVNGSVKGSLVVQTPAARIDSVADVMSQRPPPTPYTLKLGFLEKALEESPRPEFRAMHALMVRQGSFLLDFLDLVSPRTFDAIMAGTGVQISTEVAIVEHYRAACSSPGRRFHIAREPILLMMLTWYSSRHLPQCFLRQMDRRTRWLTESGLPVYRRERLLSQIRSCLLRERTARSEVQEPSALTLRDVKAAFYIFLTITAAALVAFLGEVLVGHRCRTRAHMAGAHSVQAGRGIQLPRSAANQPKMKQRPELASHGSRPPGTGRVFRRVAHAKEPA